MDKRFELIDALLTLGKQAEKVAKLLSAETVGIIKDETILINLPKSDTMINVESYKFWPEANFHNSSALRRAQIDASSIQSLANLTVLEYSIGQTYPISPHHPDAKIALITDAYKFDTQPQNVKIINSFSEAGNKYDVGILWETLEFDDNPAFVLTEMRQRCNKIVIRFRPWTSRNGAFQSEYYNKAFAQLVGPLDHKVKFKVVRPLATYESLFTKLGLSIQERKINSVHFEEFFQNDIIINTIIERTWGNIRKDEAVRIMMTDSIDYIVS